MVGGERAGFQLFPTLVSLTSYSDCRHRTEPSKDSLESKRRGTGGDWEIHTRVNFLLLLHVRGTCPSYTYQLGFHIDFF